MQKSPWRILQTRRHPLNKSNKCMQKSDFGSEAKGEGVISYSAYRMKQRQGSETGWLGYLPAMKADVICPIIILSLVRGLDGIECFQCNNERSSGLPPCSTFSSSDLRFVVSCKDACMETSIETAENTTGVTQRDCWSGTEEGCYPAAGGQTVCSCLSPLCNCPSCPMPLRSRSGAGTVALLHHILLIGLAAVPLIRTLGKLWKWKFLIWSKYRNICSS